MSLHRPLMISISTSHGLFFIDVHLHTGEILHVQDTPAGSGWGTVPTPMF
jgi:hypothetical protein